MAVSIGTFIQGLLPSRSSTAIDCNRHSFVEALQLKASNETISELTETKIDQIFNRTYLIPKAGVTRECIVARDLVLEDFKSPLTRSSFQDLGRAKDAIADAWRVVNGMSKSKARNSLSWQLKGLESRVDNAIRFWKQEASTIQSQPAVSEAEEKHLALALHWLGDLADASGSPAASSPSSRSSFASSTGSIFMRTGTDFHSHVSDALMSSAMEIRSEIRGDDRSTTAPARDPEPVLPHLNFPTDSFVMGHCEQAYALPLPRLPEPRPVAEHLPDSLEIDLAQLDAWAPEALQCLINAGTRFVDALEPDEASTVPHRILLSYLSQLSPRSEQTGEQVWPPLRARVAQWEARLSDR